MAVVGLHRPVLVRLAGIAAAGEQAVVGAKVVVSHRDVLRRLGVEVAIGRRQAVGAMLARHAAKGPERVLEVLGQRREALAAEDDGGVLPTAVGHDEVEEPVRERRAGDGDAELSGVGEVRQRHAARLGRLAEDHVSGCAVERSPISHATLQRAPDAVVGEGIRIGHLQMAQERDRLHGGIGLQDRQQHRLPDRLDRIGNGTATLRLALRRQARIDVDPASGALAEPGPGSGGSLAVTKSVLHVQSHLLVGDGFARHGRDLRLVTEIPVVPARSGQHPRLIPQGRRARRCLQPTAGLRPTFDCRQRPTWLSASDRVVVADHQGSLRHR